MKKILFLFVFIFFLFTGVQDIKAATVDMTGYAWGADSKPFGGVGWINFNNTPTGSNTAGAGPQYKVTFDRATSGANKWMLDGYAYSENYGYIKFGDFGNSAYPSALTACENVNGSNNDANCHVHLIQNSNGGYELAGYARFCFVYASGCSGTLRDASELGGNDGWIGFKGSNFSVNYSTNNTFNGFAWGGGGSDKTESSYGQGAGWINVNPKNDDKGVRCVVGTDKDCVSDNAKPKVTLSASPTNPAYNESVTLTWDITTSKSSCDTITASNKYGNTNWDSNTSITSMNGSLSIGAIDKPLEIFTLACEVNGPSGTEVGTADVVVNMAIYTPTVSITATPSIDYGYPVTIHYDVSNAPFGCNGVLYRNSTSYNNQIQETRWINGAGSTMPSYTESGDLYVYDLGETTTWEFACTDSTPPSPERYGNDTAQTTVIIPNVVMTFSAKDTSTNSTTTIPCTNTGVTLTYNVASGSNGICRALVNGDPNPTGWGTGWGNGNTIDPTNGANKTVTTGVVDATGNGIYQLQCQKSNGQWQTAGSQLYRSTTCGDHATLSVSSPKTKYCTDPTIDPQIDINYEGKNIQANSCTKSTNWIDSGWLGSQSNFTGTSSFSPSYLGVGFHTFSMGNCLEESFPTNPALSDDVTIEVTTTCTQACTDECNPACSNYKGLQHCTVCTPGSGVNCPSCKTTGTCPTCKSGGGTCSSSTCVGGSGGTCPAISTKFKEQ